MCPAKAVEGSTTGICWSVRDPFGTLLTPVLYHIRTQQKTYTGLLLAIKISASLKGFNCVVKINCLNKCWRLLTRQLLMKYCIERNKIKISLDKKHKFIVCIVWLYAYIKDIIIKMLFVVWKMLISIANQESWLIRSMIEFTLKLRNIAIFRCASISSTNDGHWQSHSHVETRATQIWPDLTRPD